MSRKLADLTAKFDKLTAAGAALSGAAASSPSASQKIAVEHETDTTEDRRLQSVIDKKLSMVAKLSEVVGPDTPSLVALKAEIVIDQRARDALRPIVARLEAHTVKMQGLSAKHQQLEEQISLLSQERDDLETELLEQNEHLKVLQDLHQKECVAKAATFLPLPLPPVDVVPTEAQSVLNEALKQHALAKGDVELFALLSGTSVLPSSSSSAAPGALLAQEKGEKRKAVRELRKASAAASAAPRTPNSAYQQAVDSSDSDEMQEDHERAVNVYDPVTGLDAAGFAKPTHGAATP
jgi:DNA repair exonuclease SbcCD ATPase subunit